MQKKRNPALKLIILLFAFFALTSSRSFSAETVDFFATVSSSKDTGMIKMTTDLLFNQFQTVDGYTVRDRRNETYISGASTANISFFAEIQEDPDGGWLCTLNAIKPDGKQNVSATKKYDSYYKILLDARPSLENLLTNLTGNIQIPEERTAAQEERAKSTVPGDTQLDAIAGTWTGEELIEKVLILRGGRGFVIFKNGASMNISVTVQDDSIKIRQNGRPNASFFPEIPRQEALKNAQTASPIEWNMTLSGNTLSGKKTTLVEDKNSPTGIKEGEIEVSWTKR
ncbi:TP0183 family DNA metabolism protein [Treponema sp.]|uniref:TP0183 family DNA metabolism protein n=1 Tax=Treponema sp. TaxID=166 RepID=UPI003F0FF18A